MPNSRETPDAGRVVSVSTFGPRRFWLLRREDPSGISGIGRVAEGIRFSDGSVAMRWLGACAATAVWDSIDDVLMIHGHNGRTTVEWIDS